MDHKRPAEAMDETEELEEIDIFDAVMDGSLEEVEEFLEDPDTDINCVDENNATPLYLACQKGFVDIVRLLLKKGARTDIKKKGGITVAWAAALKGHLEVLKVLKEFNVDLDVPKEIGGTSPFYVACQEGHLECVKFLFDCGSNVNQNALGAATIRNGGVSPLQISIEKGHHDVSLWLLDNAPVNLLNVSDFGNTPLTDATRKSSLTLVQKILEKTRENIEHKPSYGKNALIIAVEKELVDILKLLLSKGADPNTTSPTSTALTTAVQLQNTEIVIALLDAGASLELFHEIFGNPPLICAVMAEDLELAKILLERGAKIDCTARDGSTALHLAVQNGDIDLVKILLKQGADINKEDKDGYSPLGSLLHEIANPNQDIIQHLVKNGANLGEMLKRSYHLGYLSESKKEIIKSLGLINESEKPKEEYIWVVDSSCGAKVDAKRLPAIQINPVFSNIKTLQDVKDCYPQLQDNLQSPSACYFRLEPSAFEAGNRTGKCFSEPDNMYGTSSDSDIDENDLSEATRELLRKLSERKPKEDEDSEVREGENPEVFFRDQQDCVLWALERATGKVYIHNRRGEEKVNGVPIMRIYTSPSLPEFLSRLWLENRLSIEKAIMFWYRAPRNAPHDFDEVLNQTEIDYINNYPRII